MSEKKSLWKRFWFGFRHPSSWLRDVCGGQAVYPLVVLFGLNAVDELDRAAFGIPDNMIRVACGIEDTADLVADFAQALDRG